MGLFVMVLGLVNFLVWWSVFIVMDLVFIFICKGSSFSVILNYFVFQECLALLFLFLTSSLMQCVIVMSKMGLVPFHYWLFVVVGGLKGWLFMWFLTFQKLPFMGVLMLILVEELIFLILVGFFLCYFQLLLVKDYKLMLLLNSTESFNWIVLGYMYSFFSGFVLFLFYVIGGLLLFPFFGLESVKSYEWLVIIVYVNVPLGVSFLVKFFVLGYIYSIYLVWFVVVLFFMFMNFLSLLVWLVVKSLEEGFFFGNSRFFFYLIFGLIFLLLFYHCSKSFIMLFWWSRVVGGILDDKWWTIFIYGVKWGVVFFSILV